MDLLMSRDLETTMNYGEGMLPYALTERSLSYNRPRGLTPDIFWSYRSTLLTTTRSDLESVIDGLVRPRASRENRLAGLDWTFALKPVPSVHGRLLSAVISELPNPPPPLSPASSASLPRRLAYVLITPNEIPVEEDGDPDRHNILQIPLPAAASAHSNFLLYNILPRAIPFIRKHLTAGEDVCVGCPTGKDLGPGVILTALSLFFSDDGDLLRGDGVDNEGEPAGEGRPALSIE
jgi:hypothetical protein